MMTQSGHPIKYPVDSLEAVRIYREMWEGATFKGYDDTARNKLFTRSVELDPSERIVYNK
jgi:hypothetical protein